MTIIIQDKVVMIDIYVQPGAKVSQVCGLHGERLKLKINSPPVDGKANQEVINFFAEILHLPKRMVVISSGEKSRSKRVTISDTSAETLNILRKLNNE